MNRLKPSCTLIFLVFLQSAGCVDEINRWLDFGKILGLFQQNVSLVFRTLNASQKVGLNAKEGGEAKPPLSKAALTMNGAISPLAFRRFERDRGIHDRRPEGLH
jgi:hypothetical protein